MVYDSPYGLIVAAIILQVLTLLMIGSPFVLHKVKGLVFYTSDYLVYSVVCSSYKTDITYFHRSLKKALVVHYLF